MAPESLVAIATSDPAPGPVVNVSDAVAGTAAFCLAFQSAPTCERSVSPSALNRLAYRLLSPFIRMSPHAAENLFGASESSLESGGTTAEPMLAGARLGTFALGSSEMAYSTW